MEMRVIGFDWRPNKDLGPEPKTNNKPGNSDLNREGDRPEYFSADLQYIDNFCF